jgi:regulator of sigma E protease
MFGLDGPWTYIVSFVVVLSAIVYVHELGHYWVARWCNIKIDVFSIGFGHELFGWYNRHGTRWRISAIPLGGYVKFFGDESVTSRAQQTLAMMTPEERQVSFHHKPLPQRIVVALAGPAANFMFAIAVYALLFMLAGQPYTPPVVAEVISGSAADEAGIMVGDRIVKVDGQAIARFEELRGYVVVRSDTPVTITVRRQEHEIDLTIVPRRTEIETGFGGTQRVGQIGIRSAGIEFQRHGPLTAVVEAVKETQAVVTQTLFYLGRVIGGQESSEQLAGPLGIAKISGDIAKVSLAALVSLMATLSVAIGLVNLFPIPMLDGGHLLFYAIEAVRGRPLGAQAQEYGFRIGLAVVISLFLLATWNDLNRLRVVDFFMQLFS